MRCLLAVCAATAMCAGCITYPDADERFSDEIVATANDPSTDFTTFQTFAIAPNVDYVDATTSTSMVRSLDGSVADPLVNEVSAQLVARGYQRVEPNENPDLGAKLTVIKSDVENVGYAPAWGYDPYYWGYYYGYFVPVYYGYDTTLVWVDLIDVRSAEPQNANGGGVGNGPTATQLTTLPSVWSAIVYGVLESTVATETGQAVEGIDQAFDQSPYLRSQ